MAIPEYRYRDPEQVAMADERGALKRMHGCRACRRRDKTVEFHGKSICGAKMEPNKSGWCKQWSLDEAWEAADDAAH